MSNWMENEKRADVLFNLQKKYICIEHPALVVNPDKALKTLKGVENIEQIYSEPVKRMPLQWRPDDIYCKATYGDRFNVTNMVMKVKKRTRKRDGKEEYSIEILGRVDTTYRFQSMCDFQYLPIKTNSDGTHESIYEKIHIASLIDRQEYFSRDTPLFIPPIMFSRVDKPCDFLYRQGIEHRGQYKNPDTNRPDNLIGTVRQKRSIYTIFVNFGETLPTKPVDEALKKLTAEFVDPEGEKVVKKLLEEKPLWLKVEMEQRTGYRGDKLKTFLPALCFYWLDGPWRGQWNKFGFNPTTETLAKLYQTIDFRIRQWKPGQLIMKAKRSDLKMNQWNQLSRNQKHNVKISLEALGDKKVSTSKKKENTIDQELYYKFKADRIPPQRMMYYPANYVEIEEVQKLLHSNDGKETSCTEKDGWCVKDFNEKARDIMYHYMNRLLTLDDSVEMKFWRTKKRKRQLARLHLDSDEETNQGEGLASEVATSKDGQIEEGEKSRDGQIEGDISKDGIARIGRDGYSVGESSVEYVGKNISETFEAEKEMVPDGKTAIERVEGALMKLGEEENGEEMQMEND